MQRESLKIGQKITFQTGGCNAQQYVCEITGYLGEGGNSLAYSVRCDSFYPENPDIPRNLVVKECYPLSLANAIIRNGDELVANDSTNKILYRSKLGVYLEQYRRASRWQKEIYKEIPNHTSSPVALCEHKNGTSYILSSVIDGKSLSEVRDNITNIGHGAKILANLCGVLSDYHKNCLVYLDVKPENILLSTIPGSGGEEYSDQVALFDFDTVHEIATLQAGYYQSLSSSGNWSPFEQRYGQKHYQEIGVTSDVYSVGAVLFWLLFNRPPDIDEVLSTRTWHIDKDQLNEGIQMSPPALRQAENILNHTLTLIPKRFSSMSELRDNLLELAKLTDPRQLDVMDNLHSSQREFVGRKDELKQISYLLEVNGFVTITGLGGIGKSELALEFAKQNRGENLSYERVVYLTYSESIRSTLERLPVANANDLNKLDAEERFNELRNALLKCGKETLVIIDNYEEQELPNDEESRLYMDIVSGGKHVIITTRKRTDECGEEGLELGSLADEELVELYSVNRKADEETKRFENEYVKNRLLDIIGRHTLMIVLVAKFLNKASLKLEQICDILSANMTTTLSQTVKHGKSGQAVQAQTINKHLETLFDLSDIQDKQRQLMTILTLIPRSGIYQLLLARLSESYFEGIGDFDNTLDSLVDSSWINRDDSKQISLHPLISDIAAKQLKPDSANCMVYLECLMDSFGRWLNRNQVMIWSQCIYAEPMEQAATRIDENTMTTDSSHTVQMITIESDGNNSTEPRYTCDEATVGFLTLARLHLTIAECVDDAERMLSHGLKALEIYEYPLQAKFSEELARAYRIVGDIYQIRRDYELALASFHKATRIYQALPRPFYKDIGACNNLIAEIYQNQGKFDLAKDHFKIAKNLCEQFSAVDKVWNNNEPQPSASSNIADSQNVAGPDSSILDANIWELEDNFMDSEFMADFVSAALSELTKKRNAESIENLS